MLLSYCQTKFNTINNLNLLPYPTSSKKFPGFSGGSDSKESACNAGDPGLIPRSERFHGEGNGNPLQYSCLEKTQWTEELGGLQSMGLQRVGHD